MGQYFGGIPMNSTIGKSFPGGAAASAENPFKRDAKGSIKSIGAISRAVRTNEAEARRLCREAGEPVARWFPENPR